MHYATLTQSVRWSSASSKFEDRSFAESARIESVSVDAIYLAALLPLAVNGSTAWLHPDPPLATCGDTVNLLGRLIRRPPNRTISNDVRTLFI